MAFFTKAVWPTPPKKEQKKKNEKTIYCRFKHAAVHSPISLIHLSMAAYTLPFIIYVLLAAMRSPLAPYCVVTGPCVASIGVYH